MMLTPDRPLQREADSPDVPTSAPVSSPSVPTPYQALDAQAVGGNGLLVPHAPPKHRALIEHWVAALAQIPAIDVVWLTGSLATVRATPGADIDLRFAIADAGYEELWERDRTQVLAGLGEYLLLTTGFVRALTAGGLIAEAWAFRTSELDGFAEHEWEVLFSRLPDGLPVFHHLPSRSPAETWPAREALSVEEVRNLTKTCLFLMATASTPLYLNELHSARFILDDLRTELIRLMYRRIGLVYAKRFKHLSTVLPSAFLADLACTHLREGCAPFDKGAIATALIATFKAVGSQLQAMSDQVGGGFEPLWYWRLHEQVSDDLHSFEQPEGQTAISPG